MDCDLQLNEIFYKMYYQKYAFHDVGAILPKSFLKVESPAFFFETLHKQT